VHRIGLPEIVGHLGFKSASVGRRGRQGSHEPMVV
jgi:hypothetical protein